MNGGDCGERAPTRWLKDLVGRYGLVWAREPLPRPWQVTGSLFGSNGLDGEIPV